MQKEMVNDKEAICLFILFVFGSSLIMGVGGAAKNDAWLAAIVGAAMALPMFFVYSRLLSLNHGNDLFDILQSALGKTMGAIMAVVYIFYAFHLGALALRNFGEFANTVALPETPMIVPMLFMGIVCIVGARLGIEVLGRITTYFIPLIFLILLVIQLLAISQLNLGYIKPFLGNGIKPVLTGAFSAFSFPFAETVLFIGAFSALKTKKSPYKVYSWGIVISSFFIVILAVRNIGVLGSMVGNLYFPSYAAVSSIQIGDFVQRIEVTVSIVFMFSVFIKCAICLLVATKGLSKILRLDNYRSIVVFTGLLMSLFAYTVYDNSMEMRVWAFKVYPYYAFPMQVVFPLIVWLCTEIKAKRRSAQ